MNVIKDMIYCVGLTGNIASGKSTVATYFSQLGIQILNADHISKQLTLEGTPTYQNIVNRYGGHILEENNQLNRKKLREIIFTNPKERLWLEHLLHPQIRQQLEKDVALCTSPYCLVEIPLLNDRTHYPYLHRVLLVMSAIEVQVQRIITRDQCTEEQALAIIATQPSIEDRISNANDILVNNDDLHSLKQEVENLHHKYLGLSKVIS